MRTCLEEGLLFCVFWAFKKLGLRLLRLLGMFFRLLRHLQQLFLSRCFSYKYIITFGQLDQIEAIILNISQYPLAPKKYNEKDEKNQEHIIIRFLSQNNPSLLSRAYFFLKESKARQFYYVEIITKQMQLSRHGSSKGSITRRALSSAKLVHKSSTARQTTDVTISNKPNSYIKQVSNRDKKVNNFFDNLTLNFDQIIARSKHKKHKTTKISLKNQYEKFLLKKSDKAKLLYWNNDVSLANLPKIVISADYIFDQDAFWQGNTRLNDGQMNRNGMKASNDSNQQGFIRQWKNLHKNNFIIWLIRKRNSWNKLQDLVSNHELPIHATFYVKKKRNYTIDITVINDQIQKNKLKLLSPLCENVPNIMQDIGNRENEQKLLVFETVKLNLKDVATYHSYEGRIPVLIGVSAKVILMRIQNNPPGLQSILKYLSKSVKRDCMSVNQLERSLKLRPGRLKSFDIYFLSSIRNYLAQYIAKAKNIQLQSTVFSKHPQDFEYEQEQITSRIEQVKKGLIDKLIKQQGRGYQFQGGSSIYNFVGEMIKRNYRIIEDNILAEMQAKKRVKKKVQGSWIENEIKLDLRVEYYEMYLN